MSTARSVFTEAIEDHLALKKQNTGLEAVMPLARYDVGDPLDRYPGGPNRNVDPGTVVVADAGDVQGAGAAPAAQDPNLVGDATQVFVGPSPEQAMEAATALEPSFAARPFEPLTGLAPMLSLVEDIDDEDDGVSVSGGAGSSSFDALESASVLRFPGGVGPRPDEAADAQPQAPQPQAPVQEPLPAAPETFDAQQAMPLATQAITMPTGGSATMPPPAAPAAAGPVHDAPTGEQPVLVIDTDEPLATSDWSEPAAPVRNSRRGKPRFFGLGRKKQREDEQADGWFTDGPRDFNWD